MPRPSTPEAAFRTAQGALAQGDWQTFFSLLDPREVRTITRNGLNVILNFGLIDEIFQTACAEGGFPLDSLREGHRRGDTKQVREAIDSGLRSVSDLPAFSALVERHIRQHHGGGSVAATLFQGEHLEDLEVEGNRAWATRHDSLGAGDPIGFTCTAGQWRIRLFAQRRQR